MAEPRENKELQVVFGGSGSGTRDREQQDERS
jgi:hypothetical protein